MARKRPAKARRRPRRRALGDPPEQHRTWAEVRLGAAERALARVDPQLDPDIMSPQNCDRALRQLVEAQDLRAVASAHRASIGAGSRRNERFERFDESLKDNWRRFRWKCEVVPKKGFARRPSRR